jgi:C_GCAxxG_C_C family probable redox protein
MKNSDRAVDSMKKTFSCSQAVFSTFSPALGLDEETALRVAGAFGGGMARMGETCGAVTGALMVIGLKHGKIKADDDQAREKTYSLAREFVEKFRVLNGSIVCKDLLGFDIGTAEGMKLFNEKHASNPVCLKFVADAAEIVEEILNKA